MLIQMRHLRANAVFHPLARVVEQIAGRENLLPRRSQSSAKHPLALNRIGQGGDGVVGRGHDGRIIANALPVNEPIRSGQRPPRETGG